MAGGGKVVQVNTQERAVSSDIMRLQSFAGANLAEVMRYLMNVTGNDDLDAAGVITEYSTVGTPLRAEIINGLLVKPQAGVLDLLVDPGVLFAIAPDAAADDSNYKLVKDPGISGLGVLAMTANGSGSIRIDVVEVQVSSVVSEVDTRDIFNPSTGLFAATSVTKARQSTVTTVGSATNIRVRAGTPGAGMPALASGWLPLAVASVPTGTTTNDTITFWDVRPLISDREFGPFGLTNNAPHFRSMMVNAHAVSNTTVAFNGLVSGHVDVGFNGRRLGGRLRRGTPGTDNENVDISDAANAMPGNAFADPGLWHLYLCTPFGLPRWARYTAGPAGRVPRSPRGIAVYSSTAPTNVGRASASIGLPASTGLVGSAATTEACCVAVGRYTTTAQGVLVAGDEATLFRFGVAGDGSSDIVGAPVANYNLPYALVPGVFFPVMAKAVLVEVQMTFAGAHTGPVYMQTHYPGGPAVADQDIYGSVKIGNIKNSTQFEARFWVPIPSEYPGAGGSTTTIEVVYNTTDPTSNSLRVVGWKY